MNPNKAQMATGIRAPPLPPIAPTNASGDSHMQRFPKASLSVHTCEVLPASSRYENHE